MTFLRLYRGPVSTTDKESVIEELKPSMARAPRLRKKTPPEKSSRARAGVHYEVLDTKKHIG